MVWCANLSKSDYVKEMEPKLWKKYQQLVKEYADAGWGLCCDLSKDDEREAILKFGHGYYGDPHTIVRFFRQGSMAAMIQNVRVLYDRREREDIVLSEHSSDNSDNEIYQEMEKEVIRESTDRTLIQMEQYLMSRKEEVQEEEPLKTCGEVIFEALK